MLEHPKSECLKPVHLCPNFACCHSGPKDLRVCSHICSLGLGNSLPCISHHPGVVQPTVSVGWDLEGALPLRKTHFMPSFCPAEKVHAEIERVLGPDRLPTFEDRKKMPFTTAVIHEVQRFVTLLPHVPRCTSTDTHFKGYFIPKVLAALRTKSRVVHMHHTSDPQGKMSQEGGKLVAQGIQCGRASFLILHLLSIQTYGSLTSGLCTQLFIFHYSVCFLIRSW